MDRDAIEYTRQHYDAHANKLSTAEVRKLGESNERGRSKKGSKASFGHSSIRAALVSRRTSSPLLQLPPTNQQALRSRSEGAALPLKQYHNSIKRELINAFSGGPGSSLLDLACGRGGDVWKWMDAGLRYVLGVDLSPGEVAEAARRFEEARSKRAGGGGGGVRGGRGGGGQQQQLVAEFRECATLGLEPFSAEPPLVPSSGDAAPPPGGDGGGTGGRTKPKRRRRRRRFDSVSCMFAAHYFCSSDAALSTFLANVARNLRPVR